MEGITIDNLLFIWKTKAFSAKGITINILLRTNFLCLIEQKNANIEGL